MKFKHLYAIASVSAMLAIMPSCGSHRESLAYFQDADSSIQIPVGEYSIKVEPSDELLITVMSASPEVTAQYNIPLVNPATNEQLNISTQPRQQTYIVDPDGDITMPVIGKIHVAGLTVQQIQSLIATEVEKDVEDPIVKVEVINFMVNVAGEVMNPGRYPVTTQRFSVLDALASAGDLTPYGVRENVMIIREENGVRTAHRLDLTSPETLSSPYFFIKQNDYIYVEPTKVRKDNADYNTNNSFKLSVVSTIVSSCSVIASLIIALTR